MIYPIGIQSFESLRNDGYVYVDKTCQIYELATTGRYYVLSRAIVPRPAAQAVQL